MTSKVLDQKAQAALTPEDVVALLRQGNARFVDGEVTTRDHRAQIRKAVEGQYPKAVILSCVDSRVPVEDVFDCGIGDLFVARVAGNIVNEDILGSLEFACRVAGSKLVVVLGHEHCGAVKSAVDDVKLGNISTLLEKIRPAVEATRGENRTSANADFVHAVCEQNVRHAIARIRAESSILSSMEVDGEIDIVGALYDMDNGAVSFL